MGWKGIDKQWRFTLEINLAISRRTLVFGSLQSRQGQYHEYYYSVAIPISV